MVTKTRGSLSQRHPRGDYVPGRRDSNVLRERLCRRPRYRRPTVHVQGLDRTQAVGERAGEVSNMVPLLRILIFHV